MENYRVHYKDYWGESHVVNILAISQEEAIKRFEYEYGDCKLIYIS